MARLRYYLARKIRYTPKANFNGADFFHYTIDDGLGHTDSGRVNININPVNDAPTLTGHVYTMFVNERLEVDFPGLLDFAYDPDGDSLAVRETSDVSHGSIWFNEGRDRFTYRPDEDFVGTDSFTFRVRDEAGLLNIGGAQTITIRVYAVPPPPVQAVDDASHHRGRCR